MSSIATQPPKLPLTQHFKAICVYFLPPSEGWEAGAVLLYVPNASSPVGCSQDGGHSCSTRMGLENQLPEGGPSGLSSGASASALLDVD